MRLEVKLRVERIAKYFLVKKANWCAVVTDDDRHEMMLKSFTFSAYTCIFDLIVN